jgi:hypothetical protein
VMSPRRDDPPLEEGTAGRLIDVVFDRLTGPVWQFSVRIS